MSTDEVEKDLSENLNRWIADFCRAHFEQEQDDYSRRCISIDFGDLKMAEAAEEFLSHSLHVMTSRNGTNVMLTFFNDRLLKFAMLFFLSDTSREWPFNKEYFEQWNNETEAFAVRRQIYLEANE